MPNPETNAEPPLVDVKVTNPLTYIKRWWARIIGNEGMEFRFRIRPLTAIAIAVIFATLALGIGEFVLPFSIPFFKYKVPAPTPIAEELWKDTAFIGNLQFSVTRQKYYLLTTSAAEAITLEVPSTVNLEALIGKRILAIGKYNKNTRILQVTDVKDLEILPKTPIPVPTVTPWPTPTESPTPTPISGPTASPTI